MPRLEAQIGAARAWVLLAEGESDEAVAAMRAAAARDDALGVHPISAGPVLPARELLGDLLLELGRAGEALAAHEAMFESRPNRFNALFGAGHAAERAGDGATAERYYTKLVEQAADADALGGTRETLRHARAFLERMRPDAGATRP